MDTITAFSYGLYSIRSKRDPYDRPSLDPEVGHVGWRCGIGPPEEAHGAFERATRGMPAPRIKDVSVIQVCGAVSTTSRSSSHDGSGGVVWLRLRYGQGVR